MDAMLCPEWYQAGVEPMVARQTTDAQTLARRYAELVRDDPAVRELWISSRCGVPELWLIADDLEDEHELSLYGLVSVLYDEFADARLYLHVVSPKNYLPGIDLRSTLPRDAKQFQLYP
jgi:hypothetical protein